MHRFFKIRFAILVITAVSLSNCSSSKPLQQAFITVEEIQPKLLIGKSTITDMKNIFGKPSTESKNFLGYYFQKTNNDLPLYISLLFKNSLLAGYKIIQSGKNKIEEGLESVDVDEK